MEKKEQLKKLFIENGLEKEDVFKSPQGYVIITRTGIEKIQYRAGISVSFQSEKLDPEFVVVKATAKKGSVTIESYGEASPKNCKNSYVVAMAEKRALARVVLKVSGFYELGVFAEDEAEAFTRTDKPVDGMD